MWTFLDFHNDRLGFFYQLFIFWIFLNYFDCSLLRNSNKRSWLVWWSLEDNINLSISCLSKEMIYRTHRSDLLISFLFLYQSIPNFEYENKLIIWSHQILLIFSLYPIFNKNTIFQYWSSIYVSPFQKNDVLFHGRLRSHYRGRKNIDNLNVKDSFHLARIKKRNADNSL